MADLVEFAARCLLVILFLPFSALDKILNAREAVGQASKAFAPRPLAAFVIAVGCCLEVGSSVAIITGFADRLAALVLAAYCVITALLWKQFWLTPDFKLRGASRGREIFWDFLKNISLAGGLLLLAVGASAPDIDWLIHHPFASTHPYRSFHSESFLP